MCEAIGLNTNTVCRDDIQLYGGNAEALLSSINAIQKVAALMIRQLIAEDAPASSWSQVR